jgi:hypothetical protein
MAITPWSWTASNGTATAAQTRRAYNALISNSYTSEFSRYVWNDLVNKANEVTRALNRIWNEHYTSYNAAKASYLYQNLTAPMFNSVRLNTQYPKWWWADQAARTGYIGRTEVRGVADYGDSGADIVYGSYLLELAEKLNLVIGIVNGTQDVSEMNALLAEALTVGADAAPVDGLLLPRTRHRETLSHGAFLQSENLPTMTIHFIIPTAEYRAYLESEELSSMMQGSAYMTLDYGGRLNRLHSVQLSQIFPSRVQYSAFLRTLDGAGMEASAAQGIGSSADGVSLPSSSLKGHVVSRHTAEASAVSKEPAPFGWTHYRVRLEPDAELSSELNSVMRAVGAQYGVFESRLARQSPLRLSADTDLGTGMRFYAVAENADPFGMTLHHEVSTVGFDAGLATVQYMNGLDAALDMHPLAASATLTYEHIATMLRAYLRMAHTADAELTHNVVADITRTVDVRVEITADAVSDFAPNISKAVEIALTVGSELHGCFAPKLLYRELITLTPAALQHTAAAGNLGEIRHFYSLIPQADIIKAASGNAVAHSRIGHTYESDAHVFPAEYGLNGAFVFAHPQTLASLIAPEALGTFHATGRQNHVTEAALEYIRGVIAAEARAEIALTHGGELGSVFFTDMEGRTAAELVMSALIEAEGGGWQYPVIVDTDAAIFQVWLTEQNRQHLFLDPTNGRHHAQIRAAVSGAIDKQFRVDAGSEINHRLAVYGEMNKRQRGNWEYPVQTDNVLLVTQAIDALPHYQYNLEVR